MSELKPCSIELKHGRFYERGKGQALTKDHVLEALSTLEADNRELFVDLDMSRGEAEGLRARVAELEDNNSSLEAENAKLREFCELMSDEAWGRFDSEVDPADLQDHGERLGLIVEVPGSDYFKEIWGEEDGATMMVWSWSEAARKARPPGQRPTEEGTD